MIKWKIEQAITFCDDVKDGTHDSPKQVSNGYKLLTSKHITNGVIDTKSAKTISPIDYETINKRSKVDVNDILFSMIGTIGSVCRIASEPNFAIKNMGLFKVSDEIRSKYLYYYLQSPTAKEYIASATSGSTQQYISLGSLRKFPIKYPSQQSDMQRMVEILDSLQKKITLNNRINDYLTEALQTRFIHWIESEDDPWGSMDAATIGSLDLIVTDYVANGSFASLKQNVELLNDGGYAYFMRNTDFKSGSFNVFVPEHSYRFLSKSALHGGEVIISNVGDVGSVHRCPVLDKPMTLGNNEILVKGTINDQHANDYLYLLFKSRLGQHLIDSVTGGSVQRKFNKTDFKSIEIPLPSKSGLRAFNCWSKPFFKTIEANRNEARYLESLRDSLLPKLMSGEIDVSKVVV